MSPAWIAADWQTLMRQAWMTAADYMDNAVREIDAKFGQGYAEKNPALVAGFMQAAASDFHAAAVGVGAQRISEALDGIGRTVAAEPEDAR
jgi:hypothetical protein